MSKPNFATMTQKELHDYFLTHRDDHQKRDHGNTKLRLDINSFTDDPSLIEK